MSPLLPPSVVVCGASAIGFLKKITRKEQQEEIDAQILIGKLKRADQWDQSRREMQGKGERREERHFISNFHGKFAVVAKRGGLMGVTAEEQQQQEEFKTELEFGVKNTEEKSVMNRIIFRLVISAEVELFISQRLYAAFAKNGTTG